MPEKRLFALKKLTILLFQGRAKFQEKMTGKTRSVSGRKTNDELDAWVKNHTTHSFRRAKADNISRASGTSKVETGRRFTRNIHNIIESLAQC